MATVLLPRGGKLTVIPCSLAEANNFVALWHRHHRPVVGHKFSIAVCDDFAIRGVAIIGRPVSRHLDDGKSLEVTRVATDGETKNACSMLYAAARRAAKAMGYRRLVTYTLESEKGITLKAAGWRPTITTDGGSWSRPSRGRTDKAPIVPKQRWEAFL